MAMWRAGLRRLNAETVLRSEADSGYQGPGVTAVCAHTHGHVVKENLSFDLIIRDRERISMERIIFVTEFSVLVSENVLFVTEEGGI